MRKNVLRCVVTMGWMPLTASCVAREKQAANERSRVWRAPRVEPRSAARARPRGAWPLRRRNGAFSSARPIAQGQLAENVCVRTEVGPDALVGPFCYLRPGSVLDAGSKAGTFVEIKNSRIGKRTKVPHLSYIGDAEIGDDTNVGAGAITANFPHAPGLPKGRTRIGADVRTGIHNGFVAPVEVGDGAWTAAGSMITKDVPPNALAVARARQENKEGYAARHRGE